MAGALKVPPHNTDAEKMVLGAMIARPTCIPRVRAIVSPGDFFKESHGAICSACYDLGDSLDLVTLADALSATGDLTLVGGSDYLASIVEQALTSAGVEHHCAIVQALSRRRDFIALCQESLEDAFKMQNSLGSLYKNHRSSLQAIEFGVPTHDLGVDIANIYDADSMLKEYQGYIASFKQNRFITGINEIDRRIRGVSGGEVLTIIARAGSFKTALLQNLLRKYVGMSSWAAVFFSLEMPVASLTERYHKIIAGAGGREVESWYTDPRAKEHKENMEQAFKDELKGLYVVPTKVSLIDIAQYTSLIQGKYKQKVGVIGIDYLGLMDGNGKGEYEIVSGLATGVKNLAKQLNVPIILLCQVSRKGGSGETEVSLEYGRGSGAIEEGADFVLGAWQEERKKGLFEDPEPEYDLIVRILKNRKGPKGSRWQLDLDAHTLRIGDTAEPWMPKQAYRRGMID